ncbi:MAG TPA: BatD family protein [Chthoniobacterales bacterium]|nr:BatD family protein [Chthoniobacterales bacterium]
MALFAFGGASAAWSAEPSVTAVLSNSETAVGEPVQLEIQITGASDPKLPGEINVDGLEIRSAGTSRQYQMQNFSVSYSFIVTYTVMPLRPGSFKIPPQAVEVSGQSLRTPELMLNVAASPGQPARSARGGRNAAIDPSQIGFVEMVLPKSVGYVGEMIPVQIRLGLNVRAPVESLGSGIQIAGQGFTTQKMTEPRQTLETINDRTYQVFIFKTAIAAARSGQLAIGPAEISPVVRVPRSGGRNPMLPPGFDRAFPGMFDDPFSAPSMPREVHLKSEPATIEVKPLPPHPPASFAGAVGTFILNVDANPKKAQVGDPVTVTATVTGRGNFDRVTAPTLEDEHGWHKYPPADSFKPDDDVGISGAKTFETVLSATEGKQKLPPLVFSFFDPVKENYVTLQSEPIPLELEGPVAPAATPAVVTAPSPAHAPSASAPTPTPPPPDDILPQLDERSGARQTFTPLYAQQFFWLAQLLPLLALIGFVGWKMRQARVGDRAARRIAQLQREAAELQRKMRRDDGTSQEYLTHASRAVQIKTALAKNLNPNVVDAETAVGAFRLDEKARARLCGLFEQSDEMRYSGGPNGNDTLSAEQRREILDLVENLRA